jgi:hypothetical protein
MLNSSEKLQHGLCSRREDEFNAYLMLFNTINYPNLIHILRGNLLRKLLSACSLEPCNRLQKVV